MHDRPADKLMAEARIIVDTARRHAVTLRLIGGLAVRRYCRDLEFVDREFSDIDLIGLSRQAGRLPRVFAELGYEENRYVSQATAGAQLQYVKPGVLLESHAHFAKRPRPLGPPIVTTPLVDHVDVFLDVMRMDHDVDVRDRLEIDDLAISPVDVLITKLQIGKPAEKDVHDVVAFLKDVPFGEAGDGGAIDLAHLARVCARDWGIYHDLRTSVEIVRGRIAGYGLPVGEQALVVERLGAIEAAIESRGKPIRWRLRARAGTRLPWRREVEDRDGTPVLGPDSGDSEAAA